MIKQVQYHTFDVVQTGKTSDMVRGIYGRESWMSCDHNSYIMTCGVLVSCGFYMPQYYVYNTTQIKCYQIISKQHVMRDNETNEVTQY